MLSSHRPVFAALVLVTAAFGAGCSHTGARAPDLCEITVAAVPSEGEAGLLIAQEHGLFAQAGLRVRIQSVTSSATGIPLLQRGSAQVVSGQYNSVISEDATGRARMRILAAGYELAPLVQVVMVAKGSGLTQTQQLRGATIAVNVLGGFDADLLYTALAVYGISPSQIHLVTMPFQKMPGELAVGRVKAISEIQPYATEAAEQYGDEVMTDLDVGAAQGLPVSGYACLASWAASHPAAAAAFAQAVQQGNQIAQTSPGTMQDAMETAFGLRPVVADVMPAGQFPAGISAPQIQRVADEMLLYHQLARPFSVASIAGARP